MANPLTIVITHSTDKTQGQGEVSAQSADASKLGVPELQSTLIHLTVFGFTL